MRETDYEHLEEEEFEPGERSAQNALIEHLSEYALYPADSPIARLITERIAHLCGDEQPVPTLYVRDSPEANARALPGINAIVVDAGIIELLDYQEELDALLAHELTHLSGKHGQHQRADTLLAQLGEVRTHEIEADIRGMRLMNQRGINPRGMVSLLEKLAGNKTTDDHVASPTHGKTNERAVTIEQAAWFFDMRCLSPLPLTSLALQDRADFGTPEQNPQEPTRRQAELARKVKSARINTILEERREFLLEEQQRLLRDVDGRLTPNEAARLASILVANYSKYEVLVDNELKGRPDKEWQLSSFSSTSAAQLLEDLDRPALQRLAGQLTLGEQRLLADQYLRQRFQEEALPDDIASDLALLEERYGKNLAAGPAGEALDRCQNDRPALRALVETLAKTGLPMYGLGPSLTLPNAHFTERLFAQHRHATAAAQEELVDFLHYLVQHRYLYAAHKAELEEFDHFGHRGIDGYYRRQYEFSTWYDSIHSFESEDEERLTRRDLTLESLEDPVMRRFFMSCRDMSPLALAQQLRAASQLSEDERQSIALFWAEAYEDLETDVDEYELLPLLFSVGQDAQCRKLMTRLISGAIRDSCEQLYRKKKVRSDDSLDPADMRFGKDVILEVGELVAICQQLVAESLQDLDLTPDEEARKAVLWDSLLDESEIARDYATIAALESLAFNDDPQQLLQLLEQHTPAKIRVGGAFLDGYMLDYAKRCWQRSAQQLLARDDLLQDEEGLRLLIALGISADDVEVNLDVPAQALGALIERRSFADGMQLIFETYSHLPPHVLRHAVDLLIEHKARTADDFAQLEAAMTTHLEHFVDLHQAGIGLGSVIETNIIEAYKSMRGWDRENSIKHDRIEGMESVRFMRALLMSAQNDEELKRYVFDRWWLRYRTNTNTRWSLDDDSPSPLEEFFRVEDILLWRHSNKEARRDWWIKQLPPPGQYTPLVETLDRLYLSNDAARFIAVRKLMLGEGGVLEDVDGRAALVEALMQSWLTYEEGSGANDMMRTLLSSLMESTTGERIYQYVGPVLQELILQPPREHSPHEAIAERKAIEVIDSLVERGKLHNPGEIEHRSVAQKIINLMRGSTKPAPEDAASALHHSLRELFGEVTAPEFKQISPTQLALMTGKKSGALGVRMLQLAGQYYDIPPDECKEFSEVYDSLKGQTRLQAFNVLRREAEQSPAIAALLEDMDHMGSRLGGGSLMTVYEATMKDGARHVIGVRNPNAEYHVMQLADVMQRALESAVERTDTDAKTDLLMAESLLTDAVEWIKNELNDATFTEKDAVFCQENDTRTGTGFTKGRSRYDVTVPQAWPTGTLWVRHEEFVPGVNLNSLIVVESGETDLAQKQISQADFKDAASVLVRSLMHQINHGNFVHSDMHMGNFRITEDNSAIAVFDRYNLIPVTDTLRTTLQQTIKQLGLGNRQAAVEQVLGAVVADRTVHDLPALTQTIANAIEHESDPTKAMAHAVIELKKAGLSVPVNLSLVLRNIFSLAQLSERAGFGSIVEALLHTADEEEIARLMTSFS